MPSSTTPNCPRPSSLPSVRSAKPVYPAAAAAASEPTLLPPAAPPGRTIVSAIGFDVAAASPEPRSVLAPGDVERRRNAQHAMPLSRPEERNATRKSAQERGRADGRFVGSVRQTVMCDDVSCTFDNERDACGK